MIWGRHRQCCSRGDATSRPNARPPPTAPGGRCGRGSGWRLKHYKRRPFVRLASHASTRFAVALRLASETASPADGLLALAGNPRLAPALTALFNEPARAWTLPELARRCNVSRATFIRHFQERLGRSASDLLTDIRMTVAANALKRSELSTSAVAELAGTNRRPPSSARSSTRWGSRQPSGEEWAHAPLSSRSRFMTTHRLVADPRRMAAERLLVWRECDRPGRSDRWRRGRCEVAPKVRRLSGGGRRIRTLGPSRGRRAIGRRRLWPRTIFTVQNIQTARARPPRLRWSSSNSTACGRALTSP